MRTLSGLFQRPYYYPEEELLLKKSKKLLSILLSLALIFCILPATAFALDENETDIIWVATITNVTPTTITVSEKDGVQYRLGTTGTWTSENVFSGLYPNTEYEIFYRFGSTGAEKSVGVTTTLASESHSDQGLIDANAPYTKDYTGYVTSYSFNNDLTYHLYLKAEKYNGFTNLRLYVEHYRYSNNSSVGSWVAKVIPAASQTVVMDGVERYRFSIPGIAAKQIGDEFAITLYADKISDGKTYITPIYATSMKKTAYNILAGNDESKKTLVADFLKYCAAAQTYFGYNTNNPIDSGLSNYSSYLSPANPTFSRLNEIVNETPNAEWEISGFGLVLDSKITWKITYKPITGTPSSSLRLKATYSTSQGNEKTLSIAPVIDGNNITFSITQIAAGDFECPVTFAVYSGTNPVSDIRRSHLGNKMRTVATNADANTLALMKALINYSRSANKYFSQNN